MAFGLMVVHHAQNVVVEHHAVGRSYCTAVEMAFTVIM